MRRRGWILAAALVALADLFLLAGAAWNRVGEPQAVLTLTEREMPMAPGSDENSGFSLLLAWEGGSVGRTYYTRATPDWLDEEKLTELGFDCSVPLRAETADLHYAKLLPREGFVVLEYDGDAWARWLGEREREVEKQVAEVEPGPDAAQTVAELREPLERLETGASRLFAVDAGPDRDALRSRYPDRSRHAVVGAVFGVTVDGTGLHGTIRHLRIDRVHVSRRYRGVLEGLKRSGHDIGRDGPRYRVTLHFGRRLEPWIADLR